LKEKLKKIIHHLKAKKIAYGDARYVFNTNQSITVKDQTVEAISQNDDMGVGIRVIMDGCWGFAATSSLADDDLIKTANLAVKIARASALTKRVEVQLAKVKPYVDSYTTRYKEDPFLVPVDSKQSG